MKTILAICHALKRFFTATKSPKTMYVCVCACVCACVCVCVCVCACVCVTLVGS